MKILIVYNEENADNLFVPVLRQGLLDLGLDVRCSVNEFWHNSIDYDIIHFQWPEELVGWNSPTKETVDALSDRLLFYKNKGVRFVYTRHNTLPHYGNPLTIEAYCLIEKISDTIVYLGSCGMESMKELYPLKKHIIIRHHIYENTYNESLTKEEARAYLNINPEKFVVTAFGKFRKKNEVMLTLIPFLCSGLKNKLLLAPRMLPSTYSKTAIKIFRILLKILGVRADENECIISNDELPYYIAASDVLFIQRSKILNSGSVSLGFLFKKAVLGPDVGNVGEELRAAGNPVFNPEKYGSIIKALKQVYKLSCGGKGQDNYDYAIEKFKLATIAGQYAEAYNGLLLDNGK